MVGGELVMALSRGHRRPARARGLRALGAAPAARRRAPGTRRRRSCSRRPAGRSAAAPRRSSRASRVEQALRHPTWAMGGQDHDRLGHPDEQGPRGDRGALAVRHRRTTASTWSCIRSRSCTPSCELVRRRRARAPRAPGHARPDRLRAPPIPTAWTCPCAASTSRRSARSTSRRPTWTRFPCLRLAREAAQAGGTATCVLNAANEVAVHAFLGGRLGFMGIPAVIERTLGAAARRAGALLPVALRRRRGRAAGGRRAGRAGRDRGRPQCR